jgi:hypothetical protein
MLSPGFTAPKRKAILALGDKAKLRFYQEYMQRVAKGDKLTIAEMKHLDKLKTDLVAFSFLRLPMPGYPPEFPHFTSRNTLACLGFPIYAFSPFFLPLLSSLKSISSDLLS